jgi:hypothetical protein
VTASDGRCNNGGDARHMQMMRALRARNAANAGSDGSLGGGTAAHVHRGAPARTYAYALRGRGGE